MPMLGYKSYYSPIRSTENFVENSTKKLFRKNLEKHFKDFPLYSSEILSKD